MGDRVLVTCEIGYVVLGLIRRINRRFYVRYVVKNELMSVCETRFNRGK